MTLQLWKKRVSLLGPSTAIERVPESATLEIPSVVSHPPSTKPEDGEKFCGLPVDEDSQSELTEERVKNWCTQLKSEMGL